MINDMMLSQWFSKLAVLVPLASILVLFTVPAIGVKHTVGDSIWSIPPTTDFYTKWSSSRSFHPGDILYFEFESEMYNVLRVSSQDYEFCAKSTALALETYGDGPASVTLKQEGYHFYICDILDYCTLGLKLGVYVNATTPSLHGEPP
ncbi:hypothetical protein SSX86_018549 [Deinandra increscens subsp. villosa]|uniref:Phytocyanin domain-containing protein n=1 Tax=Deinandra increscens subsp. villosa TaxID=3103831 RepID=A0AAP0CVG4_9ASTR